MNYTKLKSYLKYLKRQKKITIVKIEELEKEFWLWDNKGKIYIFKKEEEK